MSATPFNSNRKDALKKINGWLMAAAAFSLRSANFIKAFTHCARDYT